jgi:hypothetical protein
MVSLRSIALEAINEVKIAKSRKRRPIRFRCFRNRR